MKRLAFALCLFAVPAYAADVAQPAPQIKATDTFTVTLNAVQWSAVMTSVSRSDAVSARDAGDLANAIRQQIMAKAQPQKK